nr:T9SS type A sorting domain-containing protein [Bacteroidota bacterium]
MIKNLVLLFIIAPTLCLAQKQGAVWCFGDSALVNFSDTANITNATSSVKSRGSCVSISDTMGQLIFYAFSRATLNGNTTLSFNSSHQLIQNGDSIVGEGWYHELVTIPFPDSSHLFYIFSIGVTGSSQKGLYYSIVDMNGNGGQGVVTQKNIQLQNFKMVDCLTAIKHGNGRDWWVIFRKSDFPGGSNSEYYEYLISPSGLTNVIVQSVGSLNSTNAAFISFNQDGSKLMFLNYKGLLEMYDFNRCTGIINNPINIYPEKTLAWPQRWSCAFSPTDSILYVTHVAAASLDSCYLVQLDLTATNIAASADTLWRTPFMLNMGQLKLGSDGKIYQSNNYYGGYPYNDTTYNMYNMNLSVINSPDSLGAACNLQPYSYYLGGKRTYFGLPNNPDYFLGPKVGSPCDTLSLYTQAAHEVVISNLYPNANNGTFTVNYFLQTGKTGELKIFNTAGQKIFQQHLSHYTYMQTIELNNIPPGIYALQIQSGEKLIIKKFVVK